MADADQESLGSPTVDGNTLVAMCLARASVDRMFGVVGISVTSLANRFMALGVRFIAFHNEQSAEYAASAYGYLTCRPGLLLTISGLGCAHGLAELSNAVTNTWPMVLISGSSDQSFTGHGDFQELDQIAVVKPFSKFSVKAIDISRIPASVLSVIDWVVAGRPSGTYLDLSADFLHQTVSEFEADRLIIQAEKEQNKELIEKPRINYSEIQTEVELLRKVQRPLIVFGKGAAYARAKNALMKLVESTGIPFFPTPVGKGLLLPKEVVPFNFLTLMKIIKDAILGLDSLAPILVSKGANAMDVGHSVLVQTEPRNDIYRSMGYGDGGWEWSWE